MMGGVRKAGIGWLTPDWGKNSSSCRVPAFLLTKAPRFA